MSTPIAAPSGLTDREAVCDALIAYAQSLDECSEALFRTSTTKDMVLDLTPFNAWGHDYKVMDNQDIVNAAIMESVGKMATSHHLSNFRVWLNGDRATYQCYVLAHHHAVVEQPRESPNNFYNVGGRYEGEVVKQGGKWLVKSIKITPWWIVGNVEVFKIRVENLVQG